MNNKYQEALNIIKKNCKCNGITSISCITCTEEGHCKVSMAIKTIKELIDKYYKEDEDQGWKDEETL